MPVSSIRDLLMSLEPEQAAFPVIEASLADIAQGQHAWNRATARAMLKLSDVAYGSDDKVAAFFSSPAAAGWELAATFHCSLTAALVPVDTDGFVAWHVATRQAVVCFRGTEPDLTAGVGMLLDWWTNFRIKQKHPDSSLFKNVEGLIHEGFHDGWVAARGEVKTLLAKFPGGDIQSLWFTGHSLGGALATVAAADLLDDFSGRVGLWTFAQPRVGNPAFAAWLDTSLCQRYHRVVNADDIVTHLPPERISLDREILEFSHAGTEQRLSPARAEATVRTILSLLPGADTSTRPSLGGLLTGLLSGESLMHPILDHLRSIAGGSVQGYFQKLRDDVPAVGLKADG